MYTPGPLSDFTRAELRRSVSEELRHIADSMEVISRSIYIPAQTMVADTTTYAAPTSAVRTIGSDAVVPIPVKQFSTSAYHILCCEVPIPRDAKRETSALTLGLLWVPGASWSAGNYVWAVDYQVKATNGDLSTTASTRITADVTPTDAVTSIETEFADTINVTRGDVLAVRLFRNYTADSGNDVAELRALKLKYTSNLLAAAGGN